MAVPDPCLDRADVEQAIGHRTRVQGLLERREFHSAKGSLIARWPVLVLADGGTVMLESLWQPQQAIDAAQLEPLLGRQVLAGGLLLGEPPGSLQNISLPCLTAIAGLKAVGG